MIQVRCGMRQAIGGALLEEVAQLKSRVQDTTGGPDAPSLRCVESSIWEQGVRTSVVEAQLRAVGRLVIVASSRTEWLADTQFGSAACAGAKDAAAEIMYSVATPPLGLEQDPSTREPGRILRSRATSLLQPSCQPPRNSSVTSDSVRLRFMRSCLHAWRT